MSMQPSSLNGASAVVQSMTVKDLLELAPPTPVDALLNVRLNYTETVGCFAAVCRLWTRLSSSAFAFAPQEGSLGLRTEISKLYTTVQPDHVRCAPALRYPSLRFRSLPFLTLSSSSWTLSSHLPLFDHVPHGRSWCMWAPRRPSLAFRVRCSSPATTSSSCGRATRACTSAPPAAAATSRPGRYALAHYFLLCISRVHTGHI